MKYGHSHCFWIPQLWWSGMSYKDCYRYFALQNFAQNLWHHAKWGKSIKILVEPNLLEDIYCLAQWTWTPRMDLISIFWQIFSWQILWNDWGASFHSEEPDLFLDSQLAITFSFLGRYSAVRMYPYCRRWSHISFANWIDFKFWKPLIFNRYAKATILPTWRWMALFFKVFENVFISSFMAKNSKTFMWFFISWGDHIPPVEIPLHVST